MTLAASLGSPAKPVDQEGNGQRIIVYGYGGRTMERNAGPKKSTDSTGRREQTGLVHRRNKQKVDPNTANQQNHDTAYSGSIGRTAQAQGGGIEDRVPKEGNRTLFPWRQRIAMMQTNDSITGDRLSFEQTRNQLLFNRPCHVPGSPEMTSRRSRTPLRSKMRTVTSRCLDS